MKNTQSIQNNAGKLGASCLLIFLFLSFVFSGCSSPYAPKKGSFTLSLGYERTILPATVLGDFAAFKLEFFAAGNVLYKTVECEKANVSQKIDMDAGTYNLTVTAYLDAGKIKPAAQGQLNNFSVLAGQSVSHSVTLHPFAIGTGQGTFRWDITCQGVAISTASMNINKAEDGTLVETKDIKNNLNSSCQLDSDYYDVTINMGTGQKKLQWTGDLHIYQNMTSTLTCTFTDENFFPGLTGIEVDSSVSKTLYAVGDEMDTSLLTVNAVYSDGSKVSLLPEDIKVTGFESSTVGEKMVTVSYVHDPALSVAFNLTVKEAVAQIGVKKYPTLKAAITAANGTIDAPAQITLLRDITMPEVDMTNSNVRYQLDNKQVQIIAENGQSRTINSSGNFILFAIDSNSSLTLGGAGGSVSLVGPGGLPGSGRRAVNVLSGTLIINDNVTITGFSNNSSAGGGIYLTGIGVSFTMKGGTITSNYSNNGGGVYVGAGATFTMEAGIIKNNSAGQGGGVYVANSGTFIMKGGTIYGLDEPTLENSSDPGSGAALFVAAGGTARYAGDLGNDGIATSDDTLPIKAAQIGMQKYTTLKMAMDAVPSNGTSTNNPTEIILLRNVFVPENGMSANAGYTVSANKHIRLVVKTGQPCTITATAGNFALFTVNSSASLTLGNSSSSSSGSGSGSTISLDGKNEIAATSRRGIFVDGGTLVMNNAVITGFKNSEGESKGGGGVFITGTSAIFTMNDGSIDHNTSIGYGGGVYVTGSAKFTMKGGFITNNQANIYGGGVYITSPTASTFTMDDGTIRDNAVTSAGGGVTVSGTFNMNSGTISNNTAKSGGGVAVFADGTFNMRQICVITSNEAREGSGVYSSGIFKTNGADVKGNSGELGNVYVADAKGVIELSGASVIASLTLSAKSSSDRAVVKIDPAWSGRVDGILNLRGNKGSDATSLSETIGFWEGGTVLSIVSSTLNQSFINSFPLGNFVDSGTGRQSIAPTHHIDTNGVLIKN